MPATALRKIQLGKQAGFSTDVTATVRLMAVTDASLNIVDEVLQPEELGIVAPMSQPEQVAQHAEGSFTQQASYQDLAYLLHGVFGTVGSSAAANTTYVWKHAVAVSTTATPFLSTIEYGSPSAEYQVVGGIMTNLQISCEAGGVWEASVDIIGKAVEAEALTTGLAIRDVELIRMADTAMTVDAWAGTMGTTPVAATLISFSGVANPQHHLKTFAGSLTPTSYGADRWEGTLETVLEFNAAAKAYVDGLLAGRVQRQIQLKATTGTGTGAREATIQFCGTLVDGAELFGDRDGNLTVALNWMGTYNPTFGGWLTMRVKNENAALA